MKVGLFFGSFNPIHAGHLIIANYFLEFTDLKQVWFIVSPLNPLKEKKGMLDERLRIRIVREAIEEMRGLKASDIEFKMPKPSYTIDTLVWLEEKYPGKEFVLIMGTDNLATLHKWKNYEQLLERWRIYTYPRPGSDGGKFKDHPSVTMANAPVMEISSTFIREAIRNKKDIRFFLSERVWKYITEMNLYKK